MSNRSNVEFLLGRDTPLSESELDLLEEGIIEANRTYAEGTPSVEDSIYDILIGKLQEGRPDSWVLRKTWEETSTEPVEDAYTREVNEHGGLLRAHPMMSILTVKSWDSQDFWNWVNTFSEYGERLFFSYKINGHGIRLVYNDGDLVSATTRARGGHGQDLTEKMKMALGDHVEGLEGIGEVEIRGELCLKVDNLGAARAYNPDIKSPLTAVTSLRASDDPEVLELLDLLAYNVYSDDAELDFENKSDEYDWLETHGFQTPGNLIVEATPEDLETEDSVIVFMQDTMRFFEEGLEEFGYYCDGVVAQIDSNEKFTELGVNTIGKSYKGNVALKLGNTFAQTGYTGIVEEIVWTRGSTKLTPKLRVRGTDEGAGVELGVLVAGGSRVKYVPVYTPANLLILNAKPGNYVHFDYGGESGVIPTDEYGVKLSEGSAEERMNEYLGNL